MSEDYEDEIVAEIEQTYEEAAAREALGLPDPCAWWMPGKDVAPPPPYIEVFGDCTGGSMWTEPHL